MTARHGRHAARRQGGAFDLPGEVSALLAAAGIGPADGGMAVVSSKCVSYSRGRLVDMDGVAASREAGALASKYLMSPALADLVLHESERMIGGMPGFVMAETEEGLIAPNAGIDRSNGGGTAALYPEDPHGQAEALRRSLRVRSGARPAPRTSSPACRYYTHTRQTCFRATERAHPTTKMNLAGLYAGPLLKSPECHSAGYYHTHVGRDHDGNDQWQADEKAIARSEVF